MSRITKITAKELKEMLGAKALSDEELEQVAGGNCIREAYNILSNCPIPGTCDEAFETAKMACPE